MLLVLDLQYLPLVTPLSNVTLVKGKDPKTVQHQHTMYSLDHLNHRCGLEFKTRLLMHQGLSMGKQKALIGKNSILRGRNPVV